MNKFGVIVLSTVLATSNVIMPVSTFAASSNENAHEARQLEKQKKQEEKAQRQIKEQEAKQKKQEEKVQRQIKEQKAKQKKQEEKVQRQQKEQKAKLEKQLEKQQKLSEKMLKQQGYKEVWRDEFNGNKLNLSDWNIETHEPGWVNEELQSYVTSEENIYVKNGKLYLNPMKKGNSITSGRVNTQGKHDFKYGYFEVTAKVPKGKGYLPAFWMMPTNENLYGQWPKCGEIDIMEVMGHNPSKLYGTIHYGAPHAQQQGTFLTNPLIDFSNSFHKFGVEWEADHISWYVDGVKYYETRNWFSAVEGGGEVTYPAPFDQKFYMILNLAVGGSWVGYPDESTSFDNNPFVIDSVKVYQKDKKYYDEVEKNATKPEKEIKIKEADNTGNYITNGNFKNALNPKEDWEMHLEDDANNTTYEIKDEAIKILQKNIGNQNHSVQLKQQNIPLYRGLEYTLTFDAKADDSRSIIVDVEGPEKNWTRYLQDTKLELSKDMKTYSLTFKMDRSSDLNSSVEFNLGNQGSTSPVTIKNVSLKVTGGQKVDESAIKEVRPDGNYVYNGSFQEGKNRLGYWTIDPKDAQQISVTNSENDRRLKVVVGKENISNPIIIKQTNLPLTKGDYYISYKAYKENVGSQDVQKNEADFTVKLGNTTFAEKLDSNAEAKYSHDFKFEADQNNEIELIFDHPGVYYVDDIMVAENSKIKNGSFNAGKSGFTEGFYSSAEAASVIDSQKEDNAYDLTIKNTGDADWNIQLMQDGIKLEKGKKYRLKLKAKASIDRDILVTLQHNGSSDNDWTPYSGGDEARLMKLYKAKYDQNEYQEYECVFTMNSETDNNARLSVTLGAVSNRQITQQHRICIDDIVLEEIQD
ncbi:carbohydrate binding domain-containing protein [Lachnobacterium bovis]|uniref:carbohydrate binding domain-containing protein n=1 Tax=Lachnobacterium bovis TaxID=140626 RepID=UPI00068D5386|nr:carbohydrate binding domain-containing protein [Lachnobacterium bovis]